MIDKVLTPLIIITAFLLFGIIVRTTLFKYLIKLLHQFGELWKFIIEPLKSYLIFWFFLIGVRISLPFAKLPENIFNIVSKSATVLFIITVTLAAVKIIAGLAGYYSTRTEGKLQSTTIFINLVKVFVFIIGLLVVFQSLGIKITPLITALGVGGLAVALALQDTLSNLFAGLQIIFAGQVRVGDFVMLDTGQMGEVVDITWRNSTIKTREENMVVVPNSTLSMAIVTNYDLSKRNFILKIPVGVSYKSDLDKVEKVTLEVAKEILKNVEGADEKFEPRVRFHTFNDFSIDLKVVLKVNYYFDKFLVQHEFIKSLHKRYNKEGIDIPFPIRTIEYADKKDHN